MFMSSPTVTVARCQWFAGCANLAAWMIDHPILGYQGVCDRCVDHLELRDYVVPLVIPELKYWSVLDV